MLRVYVCMYGARTATLAYQTHWKTPFLFQHGRDIHYRLIDGDIWKTVPHHINTTIWSSTCLLAGHMVGVDMVYVLKEIMALG